MMEVESWIRDAFVDTTEVSQVMERVSQTTSSMHTYTAYADEPLTTSQDSLGSMWLRF